MPSSHAKKFSELRKKILRDPDRKRRIQMMAVANEVIRAAYVVEDFCREGDVTHLAWCPVGYHNGSTCTCGLPDLREAIDKYDRVHGLVNSNRE